MNRLGIVVLAVLPLVGCAALAEDVKILWGSSTQALQEERVNAEKKSFSCGVDECFDAIVKFAGMPADPTLFDDGRKAKNFDVFIKDRKSKMFVFMGVPGHVKTTEVGVFLVTGENGTIVEVSSLSTGAKLKASEMIFAELAKIFNETALSSGRGSLVPHD